MSAEQLRAWNHQPRLQSRRGVPDGAQSHRSHRTEQMALQANPNYPRVTIRVDARLSSMCRSMKG